MKVDERRKFFALSLLFTVIITNTPSYLRDRFKFSNSIKMRTTRVSNKRDSHFVTPRTVRKQKSFVNYTAQLWNLLPDDIKNCDTAVSFKKNLKKFILNERQTQTQTQ